MYLGIDLGTTNVKALLVDDGGAVVASGAVPIDCMHSPGGAAEQDIEQIWQATCEAIRQTLRSPGILFPPNPTGSTAETAVRHMGRMPMLRAGETPAIAAVGVSSQGGAIQFLDGRDRPLGRVISWLDARGRPFDQEFTRRLGEEFFRRHLGHGSSGVSDGQVLRLRGTEPQLLAPPNRLAFVGDVIVGRLCGRRAHDASSLSIAMFYNPWLDAADPDTLGHLGLDASQLPDLLPPTAVAGRLSDEAAAATGLPAGIPVSPAVHDQYAAALGAGAVRAGDLCLGTGTAWVLLALSDKLAEPVTPGAYVCRHVVDGLYGQLLSMGGNGGSSIQWAFSLLGRGKPGAGDVDALASSAPAGSDGLRFWPLLASGPATGELAGKGGRLGGVAFAHGPAHLLRAVIEGLSCELARHLRMLEAGGVAVERLLVSGGAAASAITPQTLADVTGKPVHCVTQEAVSAFGAAILARAMLEGGPAGLARRLAPGGKTVSPGVDAPLYREVLSEYMEPFGQ